MCIICLEFNQRKDPFDALEMVAAAGREFNSIDKKHLEKLRIELEERIYEDKSNPIFLD